MATETDVESAFSPNILSPHSAPLFRDLYASSSPYNHAVVPTLINPALLISARREILSSLSFTEKETDIYKVLQTGDLANLDGLPPHERGQLAAVGKVRDALYSHEFREWLGQVTGCGPLSASKRDMSINEYRQGCHLLNHDDVISTRRLSFILYLTDPEDQWQPQWGGALELYPVKSKGTPDDVPSKVIPPQWNQFTFFIVQPGHSFHSVEEVVHPTASRLSISGWFHRPQVGEQGYNEEEEKREQEKAREGSSLGSLSATQTSTPFKPYADSQQPPLPGSPLSTADKLFLSQYINPAYLSPSTQRQVSAQFTEDSHVLLSKFLRADLAAHLETTLRQRDVRQGFAWWERGDGVEGVRIRDHAVGTVRDKEADEEDKQWGIMGPPHQQRFCYLLPTDPSTISTTTPADVSTKTVPTPLPTTPSSLLSLLSTSLFPSPSFRHLLCNLTGLVPISTRPSMTRRFRPGLDYTLARSDAEAVLDVVVDLTPVVTSGAEADKGKGKKAVPRGLAGAKRRKADTASPSMGTADGKKSLSAKLGKELRKAWEEGDVGGWECYMAPHEGEEDPAVYKSAGAGGRGGEGTGGEGTGGDGGGTTAEGEVEEFEDDDDAMFEDVNSDDAGAKDEDEEEEDGGALLNLTPTFNNLSLVLRDGGVMRFVKYVSARAGGSRWDVSGEWEVGQVEVEVEEQS